MGPVLGSLVVTEVSSHTLASHPDWQYQFRLCGDRRTRRVGDHVRALRELSPQLRDQLMVSLRDRALIQARAAGLDAEKLLKGHWRQMLRLDIIDPAFAISAFLILYIIFVGFLVVFFGTIFHYSAARTNNLANWYWIANAIALLVAGLLSDRLLGAQAVHARRHRHHTRRHRAVRDSPRHGRPRATTRSCSTSS